MTGGESTPRTTEPLPAHGTAGMAAPVRPPLVRGVRDVAKDFMRYQCEAFGQRDPAFFALELCGETGELANIEKKIWRSGKQDKDSLHSAALSDEAADVFIALMNYCNSRNIDIESAVISKLERIELRRQQGTMGPVSR